jgi:hypothetical protein
LKTRVSARVFFTIAADPAVSESSAFDARGVLDLSLLLRQPLRLF